MRCTDSWHSCCVVNSLKNCSIALCIQEDRSYLREEMTERGKRRRKELDASCNALVAPRGFAFFFFLFCISSLLETQKTPQRQTLSLSRSSSNFFFFFLRCAVPRFVKDRRKAKRSREMADSTAFREGGRRWKLEQSSPSPLDFSGSNGRFDRQKARHRGLSPRSLLSRHSQRSLAHTIN